MFSSKIWSWNISIYKKPKYAEQTNSIHKNANYEAFAIHVDGTKPLFEECQHIWT